MENLLFLPKRKTYVDHFILWKINTDRIKTEQYESFTFHSIFSSGQWNEKYGSNQTGEWNKIEI